MPTTVISLTHALDNFPANAAKASLRQELNLVMDKLSGAAGGAFPASALSVVGHATAASGTLTISGGSGAVGGTINGTTVTATWATSDTNSAALVAAAINANTTVNKFVVATASGGVVTLTAFPAGALGNACTLVASGTGVTASGAKLTGGLSDVVVPFTR